MMERIPRDWRWIIGGGLALTILLFSRGCIGRVPSPTNILYQWYPWSEVATEAAKGRANPILYDGAVQVYPWYLFAREELRSGRLPLWNPYASCGLPHAANPVTATFSPFSVPIWLFPFPLAMLLVHGAKVFLAWLFMALYLRHRGLGLFETLLGAAAFSLSGYVILWLFWHHSSTFLWLPLLFLLTDKVMERARGRDVILLGVAGALCFLSGHVETAFHNGVALGAYAVGALSWRWIRGRIRAMGAALAALRLGLAGALALALSAILLLPFLEYLAQSQVLQVRAGYPANPFWFLPSWAVGLLVPNFFGCPGTGFYWFPGGTYIEIGQGYFGVVPFALFLVGAGLAFLRRDAFGAGLALLAFVSLGVVFGIPPFFHLVTALPGFRLSANNRLLSITLFAGIVLGATALRTILKGRKEDRGSIVKAAIGAGGVILLILVLFPFAAVRRPQNLVPEALQSPVWFSGPPRWMTVHLLISLGLGGGFFLLLGLLLAGRVSRRWFCRLVAALVLIDLVWFAFPFNPMTPAKEIYPPTDLTDRLGQQEGRPGRILGTNSRLPVGTSLPYRIPDIRAYDGMGLARVQAVREAFAESIPHHDHGRILDPALMDFLGVRFLLREPPGGVERQWLVTPDRHVGEILPGVSVGQTFVAQEDNLAGVALFLGTFQRENHGPLRFHLLEGGPGGAEERAVEVDMAAIRDNRWWSFRFTPIPDSAGKRYYAAIETPGSSPGNAVTAWVLQGDRYPHGTLLESNEPVPGEDLCFRTLIAGKLGDEAATFDLYENEHVLPGAYLVREVKVAEDGDGSIALIREGKVDFRNQVVLERPLPPSVSVEEIAAPLPEGVEEGRVQVVSYLPNEVRIEIRDNPAPAVLVMSDTYYPGWAARLDGKEAPILRANHAFRAVPIPGGDHTLVFRFNPTSLRLGAGITLGAMVIALALFVMFRSRGRPGPARPARPPSVGDLPQDPHLL